MEIIVNIKEHVDGIVCDQDCLVPATLLAVHLKVPMFYIRDKKKKWGKKNLIEGDHKVMKQCKKLIYITKYKKGVIDV